MTTVTLFPIGVAALASFAVGSIWYSPLLFGKRWTALVGFDEAHIAEARARGIWKLYAAQLITTVVELSVLGFLFIATGAHGAANGAMLGIVAWIGFIATGAAGRVMWQKAPVELALIEGGASLIGLALGGAIIGAWA